jgi:RNA polymerase sigma-70 factor (ECF subfamily)
MLAYLFTSGSSDDHRPSEEKLPGDDGDSIQHAVQLNAIDAGLVARVRESDPAALESIFADYGKRLLMFATQQLRSSEAAEDIVQDVFLGLWRNREKWTVRTSIASYLFQAVRHRVNDHLQQRRGENPQGSGESFDESQLHSADMSTAPDVEIERLELQAAIERAVASLSPKTREVFQLSRDHGLSYREIAELLGVSIKTVEMHVGRALAALRLALKGWKR